MPRDPGPALIKAARLLFQDDVEERRAFTEALARGASREKALILLRDEPAVRVFPRLAPTDWQPEWVLRLDDWFRAAQHPLYDKGAYYTLDFSSIFSASGMLAIPTPPKRILDMCSSPGGKAVFAYRAFHPDVLACNETIRKRASTLIDNLQRCHVENSLVWSADPSVWGRKFAQAFDLVIVDAPCSGQSLLAKGEVAPDCFAAANIDVCVGRQRRITGHAVKAIAPGGHMLYATCTYAYKENEKIVSWLVEHYPHMEAVEIPHLAEFRSPYVDFPCYRLFPQQGLGAGAFVALIRNNREPLAEPTDLSALYGWWAYGRPSTRRNTPVLPEVGEAESGEYVPSPEIPKDDGPRRPRKPRPVGPDGEPEPGIPLKEGPKRRRPAAESSATPAKPPRKPAAPKSPKPARPKNGPAKGGAWKNAGTNGPSKGAFRGPAKGRPGGNRGKPGR